MKTCSEVEFLGVCDICKDCKETSKDYLFECSGCGIQAHQQCYGSPLMERKVEDGIKPEWLCNKCKWDRKHGKYGQIAPCFICNQKGGIIKHVRGENWAHVCCINWSDLIFYIDSSK